MFKLITAFAIVSLISLTAQSADWVDGWIDTAVYQGPSTYHGAERTFMSGPGFSARNRVKRDYPLTIGKPRLSAGCGGIDAFTGGIAFLDASYLVDKVQKMGQVAPYIAVDMALKTMSKEFSDTLNKAEALIDALNQIQMDECAMMKPVVATAFGEDPKGITDTWAQLTNYKQIKENTVSMWQEGKEAIEANNHKPTVNITQLIEGCPQEVRDTFKAGYLLENMASHAGMAGYTNLMRGFFGDLHLIADEGVLNPVAIASCSQNDANPTAFLFGGAFEKNTGGQCVQSKDKSVYEIIYAKVDTIANKLRTRVPLSPTDEKFLARSPSIQTMLYTSIIANRLNEQIDIIVTITAIEYTQAVINEFASNVRHLMRDAENFAQNVARDSSLLSKQCDMHVVAPAIGKIRDLVKNTEFRKQEITDSLTNRLIVMNRKQQTLDTFKAQYLRMQEQIRGQTGG